MKGFQWICAFLSWSKLKLILQEVSYCQLLEPAYTCREIERWKKLKHIALFFRQDKHLCMHSTSFSGSQNKSKKAGGVRKCPSEQVNIESWLWITICDVSRYPVQGQWYWRCHWPEDVDISKVWNAWGRNSHLGSGECVSTLLSSTLETPLKYTFFNLYPSSPWPRHTIQTPWMVGLVLASTEPSSLSPPTSQAWLSMLSRATWRRSWMKSSWRGFQGFNSPSASWEASSWKCGRLG